MSRAPTIVTAATEKEARRVLEWQEDVARSCSGAGSERGDDENGRNPRAPSHVSVSRALDHAPPFRRADTFPRLIKREGVDNYGSNPRAPTQVAIQRRQTHDGEQVYVSDNEEEARKEAEKGKSGGGLFGLSNKALAGTFLGAAAGVAFAYAMVKSEDPAYELEPEAPRPMPIRRSYTTGHAETIASSSRSSAVGPQQRYRVIEAPMPPPAAASSYSRNAPRERERERERELQPIAERSYYSERGSAAGTKIRSRSIAEGTNRDGSQAGTARPPTAINAAPSQAPSRHTSLSRRDRDRDDESYVSRRSNESEKQSTVKGTPSRAPPSHISSRAPTKLAVRERSPQSDYDYIPAGPIHGSSASQVSRTKSKASHHTTIKFSSGGGAGAASQAGSRAAVPRSEVRSEATWERDDVSRVTGSSVGGSRYGGAIPLGSGGSGGFRELGNGGDGYTHSRAGSEFPERERFAEREREPSVWGGRDAMSVAPSDSVSSVGSKKDRLERLRGRLEMAGVGGVAGPRF